MHGYVVLRIVTKEMLAVALELENWALAHMDANPDDDYRLEISKGPESTEYCLVDWEPEEPGKPEGGETPD